MRRIYYRLADILPNTHLTKNKKYIYISPENYFIQMRVEEKWTGQAGNKRSNSKPLTQLPWDFRSKVIL